MEKPFVDWSMFDRYPEGTVYCQCGAIYRSHTKAVTMVGNLVHLSRKACPSCQQDIDNARRVESDPEHWSL